MIDLEKLGRLDFVIDAFRLIDERLDFNIDSCSLHKSKKVDLYEQQAD